MARRRRRSHKRARTASRRSAVVVRSPAPIIVRQPAAPVHHRRRRHSSGGSSIGSAGGILSKENVGLAMGALALGFIDKNQANWKIPTVPMIGRKGSIAVISYFVGKHFHLPLAHKVCKAAIVLSAYELGNKGSISGVDVV